nr:MAG TPA: hypothetical protein [Caudoviricetes sp.]
MCWDHFRIYCNKDVTRPNGAPWRFLTHPCLREFLEAFSSVLLPHKTVI